MFYNLVHFLISLVFRPLLRIKVRGLEHIPARGGVILCSNHLSFLDPPAVGVAVTSRQLWYMARDTLFKNPFFGRLIRALHAFPVKRGTVDRASWKAFEDFVASGKAVLFFPEGTRSPDGNMQPLKAGSGMLIHRCPGAAVVPVRVFGTDKAWQKGSGRIRLVSISVCFGPQLDFSPELAMPGEKATYEKIADKLMKAMLAIEQPA